jgi:hypothetical protein
MGVGAGRGWPVARVVRPVVELVGGPILEGSFVNVLQLGRLARWDAIGPAGDSI